MTRKSPHGLRIAIRPVTHLWERWILSRALRSLRPTHPAVPAIVRRLNDPQRSPSPLHPHDSIVVGASVIAMLLFIGICLLGCLPGVQK